MSTGSFILNLPNPKTFSSLRLLKDNYFNELHRDNIYLSVLQKNIFIWNHKHKLKDIKYICAVKTRLRLDLDL